MLHPCMYIHVYNEWLSANIGPITELLKDVRSLMDALVHLEGSIPKILPQCSQVSVYMCGHVHVHMCVCVHVHVNVCLHLCPHVRRKIVLRKVMRKNDNSTTSHQYIPM